MYNPQLEDGFIRISTELWGFFCETKLSCDEWKILHYVLSKTYGFNKKTDRIALSQFGRGCHLSQRQVCRNIRRLVSKQILVKQKNGYGINKHYNQWQCLNSQCLNGQGANSPFASDCSVLLPVTVQSDTIDTLSKDTLSKDIKNIKKDFQPSDQREILFWQKYPRKVGKTAFKKAWAKLTEEERELALGAIDAHAEQDDWKKDGGKFVPHASTWLNGRRWEDELEVVDLKDTAFLLKELARLGNTKFGHKYGIATWESLPAN